MRTKRALFMLGLSLLAATALAPASDKPEQISAVQPIWDQASQEFVLQYEVQRSAIDPAELCPNCEIKATVQTTIEVWDNGTLMVLLEPAPHPVVVRASALRTADRMVPIQPQHVGWDRNGGAVSGEVLVVVTAELVWFDPEQRPTSTTSDGAILVVAAAEGPMP
jgi:hypothetical protein